MGFSGDKENQDPATWFTSKKAAFNNVLSAMRLNKPLSPNNQIQTCSPDHLPLDKTSILSDQILLNILSKLPKSQRNATSLVSKRWLTLQGRLVRSLKLLDWQFLVSGRLSLRFPTLARLDLVNACSIAPQNSGGVCVTNRFLHNNHDNSVLSGDAVDAGLGVLAAGFPNLKKLSVMNATEMGVLSVGEGCPALQELELRMCKDHVLRGIAACQNLQILRLSGAGDGDEGSGPCVSDVGLTILGQGCKELMKLELDGCRGSFEGIRAIGQCCLMLEELVISNHDMEDGWMMGLPFCENLKSLRLVGCKRVDRGGSCSDLDEEEELGCCPAIESLHLEKCQLREKSSLRALFVICKNVRKLEITNCWGLSEDIFTTATALKVSRLCIEGCSVLSTQGLEGVIVSWKELKSLKVMSCSNIKDEEISPALSRVFAALKDLKWEPDSRSRLKCRLAGTGTGIGIGKRGNKFFNKPCDWKSLPASFRTKSDS